MRMEVTLGKKMYTTQKVYYNWNNTLKFEAEED